MSAENSGILIAKTLTNKEWRLTKKEVALALLTLEQKKTVPQKKKKRHDKNVNKTRILRQGI